MTKVDTSLVEEIQKKMKTPKSLKTKIKKFLNKLQKLQKRSQFISIVQLPISNPQEIIENPLISIKSEDKSHVQINLTSKEAIEKILIDKLRKPQGNHLLHKLVTHVADKWSEEKLKNIESSQITAKMIKESLHGETVNFGRKNNFTSEEDQMILRMIIKIGKNWKEISLKLKNKTPNMIKNRYYTYLKKKYDQKYNDMVSLTSVSTMDSVKIEEEQPIKPIFKENTKNQEELEHHKKLKTLNELMRVNSLLDLEKKKILMNIVSLQRSLTKEKEKKTIAFENFTHNQDNLRQNQLNFQKNNINFLNYNIMNPMIKPALQNLINSQMINQTPIVQINPNVPITQQINHLESVIQEALKQLNNLKSACQSVPVI